MDHRSGSGWPILYHGRAACIPPVGAIERRKACVMSANRRLNRVKSPYLTAFALYLGWSVFGLQGLLVGPLGLSIMQVLYESMAEELGQ